MSTSTPPSAPPPPPSYGSGMYGGPGGPGGVQLPSINGELVFFVFAWAIVGIITLASDAVGAGDLVLATVVLGAAYLISRGVAKAGKVVEPQ